MGKARELCGAAVAFIAAAAAVPAVSRAAIMVDDFTSKTTFAWPLSTTTPIVPPAISGWVEDGLAGVLGGRRVDAIQNVTIDVPGYDTFRADLFNASGYSFLDVSSSAGAKGQVDLNYGSAAGVTPFNLGHTADTAAVRVTFLAVDLAGGTPLRIDPVPNEGGFGWAVAPAYVTSPGAQSVDIPLDGFWNTGHHQLDGLRLTIGGDNGADFRIDSISLVPEPASIAGLAVAAGAAAMRRRRA